jgi:Ca2+-binding EF-hand superfamily protein
MFTKITIATALLLASGLTPAQGRDSALEHADADHDGKVTRQEYINARSAQFARLDRNGDGFIDDADSRDRPDGSDRGKRVVAAMRGRIDANGDGKISKEEFVAAPTVIFDKFDADKNGELDAKELEAARAAGERFRERRTQ